FLMTRVHPPEQASSSLHSILARPAATSSRVLANLRSRSNNRTARGFRAHVDWLRASRRPPKAWRFPMPSLRKSTLFELLRRLRQQCLSGAHIGEMHRFSGDIELSVTQTNNRIARGVQIRCLRMILTEMRATRIDARFRRRTDRLAHQDQI